MWLETKVNEREKRLREFIRENSKQEVHKGAGICSKEGRKKVRAKEKMKQEIQERVEFGKYEMKRVGK